MIGPPWGSFAVAGVLVAAIGVQTFRLANEEEAHARDNATHLEERARQSAAALAAMIDNRRIERELQANIQANTNEATRLLSRARDDAALAAAAAVGLRRAFRDAGTCSRPGPGDPGSRAIGDTAPEAVDMRADVFEQLDDRAGELAIEADALRISGEQCAADWAALKRESP